MFHPLIKETYKLRFISVNINKHSLCYVTYFHISNNSRQLHFHLLLLFNSSVAPAETAPDIAQFRVKTSTGGTVSC